MRRKSFRRSIRKKIAPATTSITITPTTTATITAVLGPLVLLGEVDCVTDGVGDVASEVLAIGSESIRRERGNNFARIRTLSWKAQQTWFAAVT